MLYLIFFDQISQLLYQQNVLASRSLDECDFTEIVNLYEIKTWRLA